MSSKAGHVNSSIFHSEQQEFTAEEIKQINARVGAVYTRVAESFAISIGSAFVGHSLGFSAVVLSLMSSSVLSLLALTAISITILEKTMSFSSNNPSKLNWFRGFAVFQGLVLSPLAMISAPALAFAGATTIGISGGLGALSMGLKESFERYEKILFVALGVICAASWGAVLIPGAVGAFAHEVSLMGGLALFSCYMIYDTHKARSDALSPQFDEVNHAMGIYLDAMNIMIRIFEIFVRNKK